jgi:hypothetical protein
VHAAVQEAGHVLVGVLGLAECLEGFHGGDIWQVNGDVRRIVPAVELVGGRDGLVVVLGLQRWVGLRCVG